MEGPSDEALMTQICARDQRAFRIIMARHMQRVIRVAQRVTGNAAEADDIGQEVFLRVWSRAASFNPQVAKFTTWLYRITLNLAFDRMRKPQFAPIEDAGDIRSDETGVVDQLIADQERRALADAMAQLPDRQRAAITLFHMEGLSGGESAAVLNVSEKAFESLLARARLALRKQVDNTENNRRYA